MGIEKYFKRKSPVERFDLEKEDGNFQSPKQSRIEINVAKLPTDPGLQPPKQSHIKINAADLPADPGLWPRISNYNPNDQDQIRRAYLQKGPFQPHGHQFPQRLFGKKQRRFIQAWFGEFRTWLEYSIEKDVAFCLCCYLFKLAIGDQAGGDSFVGEGFSN